MNRWEVYELLKGNTVYDIKELEKTNKEEIVEGIVEYLITKKCK